jgi:hypothetical protein
MLKLDGPLLFTMEGDVPKPEEIVGVPGAIDVLTPGDLMSPNAHRQTVIPSSAVANFRTQDIMCQSLG